MRKIILSLAVSFDGFIEGPNREVDWLSFSEETGKALNSFLDEIDTILYGRVSYESWGTYTPAEDSSAFEKHFYFRTNAMTKFVFSASKQKFEGTPVVVHEDIAQTMLELKQKPGKNIWLYGGSGLISTFMNLDLVDEFRIAVFPIILGKGNPLFKNIEHRVKLKLLGINTGKSGVAEFRYERATA